MDAYIPFFALIVVILVGYAMWQVRSSINPYD